MIILIKLPGGEEFEEGGLTIVLEEIDGDFVFDALELLATLSILWELFSPISSILALSGNSCSAKNRISLPWIINAFFCKSIHA